MSRKPSPLEERYSVFRLPKSSNGWFLCFYCGDPADTLDHVPPISRVDDYSALYLEHEQYIKVACCLNCNVLLGNSLQTDIISRHEELKRILRKKNRKLLDMPEWTDSHLKELGKNLRSKIISSINKRESIERRIDYSGGLNHFIKEMDI